MEPRFAAMSEVPADAVSDFLQSMGIAPALVRWKYFDARFNRGQGERGVVLLRGDQIVGFAGNSRFAYHDDGVRRYAHWVYDWLKNDAAGKGQGRRLFDESTRRCGLVLVPGGSHIAQHIFETLSTWVVRESYVTLTRPLRLDFVIGHLRTRLPTRVNQRVPEAVVDRLGRLPLPWRPRFMSRGLAADIVVGPGVSPGIEPLLEQPPSSSMRPIYDLEYIDWALGRCPTIESATTYVRRAPDKARAAVVHWRSTERADTGPDRSWRMALFAESGAARELGAAIDHTLELALDRRVHAVSTIAAKEDKSLLKLLRTRGFFPNRTLRPLWYFRRAGDTTKMVELHGASYLDTDLAYRFS